MFDSNAFSKSINYLKQAILSKPPERISVAYQQWVLKYANYAVDFFENLADADHNPASSDLEELAEEIDIAFVDHGSEWQQVMAQMEMENTDVDDGREAVEEGISGNDHKNDQNNGHGGENATCTGTGTTTHDHPRQDVGNDKTKEKRRSKPQQRMAGPLEDNQRTPKESLQKDSPTGISEIICTRCKKNNIECVKTEKAKTPKSKKMTNACDPCRDAHFGCSFVNRVVTRKSTHEFAEMKKRKRGRKQQVSDISDNDIDQPEKNNPPFKKTRIRVVNSPTPSMMMQVNVGKEIELLREVRLVLEECRDSLSSYQKLMGNLDALLKMEEDNRHSSGGD